ncbi:Rhodanese-related sulfurtransferase [Desulfocicer vacuolatum DSM 3385]|uniref:Rhodanese-related sulfurtransferase n=1 Tax=Desulfocicer vacuolatum DSM 3385 TaxID=1121400 RepID=A0A1W2AGS4_9BACT|nr:rhodanese-like domain-containing protein [Desulfocicer vacuolatum]SMC59692.1 Rhodanese-related sulfurtransferase [Desulfocicer vacuolatum DSM 3385]
MKSMSVQAFQKYRSQKNEKDYLLIDVRQPVEYMDTHIPGAILIPLKEFEEQVEELPDKDLIFYCRNGARSKAAALTADFFDKGNRKTYNIDGGMLAWKGKRIKGVPRLKYFDPAKGIKESLLFAMNLEKGAFRFYSHIIDHYAHLGLNPVMEKIRDGETAHATLIYSHLKSVIKKDVSPYERLYAQLSGEILEGGILLNDLMNTLAAEGKTTTMDILENAINMEYHAFDLYRFMAHKTSETSLQSAFISLSQAEKNHMHILIDAIEEYTQQS